MIINYVRDICYCLVMMIKVWILKEIIKCNFNFNYLVFFLYWEMVCMYFVYIDLVFYLKKRKFVGYCIYIWLKKIVYLVWFGYKE